MKLHRNVRLIVLIVTESVNLLVGKLIGIATNA